MHFHLGGRAARLGAAAFPLALTLLALGTVYADDTPTPLAGKDRIDAALAPIGDVDVFSFELGAGDKLKVQVADQGPRDGMRSTLDLREPDGGAADVFVKRQATFRPSFVYVAPESGTFTLSLTGDREGDYRLKARIKRAKADKGTFDAADGGAISYTFHATAGSTVNLNAKTRKGGLALTELRRPDGSPEPGFADALIAARNGRKAKLKKFALTGGDGVYEVVGTYEAGSKVKLKAKVKHPDPKRNRELADDEPAFDPLFPPAPREGVVGTELFVPGQNLPFDPGELDDFGRNVSEDDDVPPLFWVGDVPVPPETISALGGSAYTFPAPAGLEPGTTHDIRVQVADGQVAVSPDAFTVIPPPTLDSLDPATAGPAGGRVITLSGSNFHRTSLVTVDGLIVQPDSIESDRVVFTVPPRFDTQAPLPETVDVAIRDGFFQSATLSGALTYLDAPVPAIDDVRPGTWLALGGETVTIDGSGFAEDVQVTIDGEPADFQRDSAVQITLTAPLRAAGTVSIVVEDGLGQSAATTAEIVGLQDVTATSIPAPNTGAGVADGWRAQKILAADVDRDGDRDLLLLRSVPAVGDSADRSRLRLLLNDGNGTFTDATSTNIPGADATDDWRGNDMALIDFDGDLDSDLLVITDDELDGGDRSSLRLLRNDGGTFVDVTDSILPDPSAYGDANQGLAVAVGDIDGLNGDDIVLLHDDYFTEVTVIAGDPTQDPPIDDIIIEDHFPAVRVLLSQLDDTFVRDREAAPAIDPDDLQQYQGDLLVVAPLTGNARDDILITRDNALPDGQGGFVRTAFLLANDGTGSFTDESDSRLPAASDPEFLQADRVHFVDLAGGPDRDLLLVSSTRMIVRSTGQPADTPALRLFVNDGSGNFAAPTNSPFPGAEDLDSLQASDVAVADFNDDLRLDVFLTSTRAPNQGDRAGRVLLRQDDGTYVRASVALPSPFTADDLRGAVVIPVDLDGDSDADLVIGRDEGDETVRNTRVIVNPK